MVTHGITSIATLPTTKQNREITDVESNGRALHVSFLLARLSSTARLCGTRNRATSAATHKEAEEMIKRYWVRPEFMDDEASFDEWFSGSGFSPFYCIVSENDGWLLIEVE